LTVELRSSLLPPHGFSPVVAIETSPSLFFPPNCIRFPPAGFSFSERFLSIPLIHKVAGQNTLSFLTSFFPAMEKPLSPSATAPKLSHTSTPRFSRLTIFRIRSGIGSVTPSFPLPFLSPLRLLHGIAPDPHVSPSFFPITFSPTASLSSFSFPSFLPLPSGRITVLVLTNT